MVMEVVDGPWVHSVCFMQQGHMGSPLAGLCNGSTEGSANQMLHQGTPHSQAQTHDQQRSHMCLISHLPTHEKDKKMEEQAKGAFTKGV